MASSKFDERDSARSDSHSSLVLLLLTVLALLFFTVTVLSTYFKVELMELESNVTLQQQDVSAIVHKFENLNSSGHHRVINIRSKASSSPSYKKCYSSSCIDYRQKTIEKQLSLTEELLDDLLDEVATIGSTTEQTKVSFEALSQQQIQDRQDLVTFLDSQIQQVNSSLETLFQLQLQFGQLFEVVNSHMQEVISSLSTFPREDFEVVPFSDAINQLSVSVSQQVAEIQSQIEQTSSSLAGQLPNFPPTR